MTEISMKHLRYFKALVNHGHFGRAADACAVTQPALSVQVKELEAVLGVKLVERAPRQVRITPTGRTLAGRIDAILKSVDDLSDIARAASNPFAGRLRLGIIPTVAPYMLPSLVKTLAREYPQIELHPHEAMTGKILAELQDSKLDAAIVALPVAEPSLKAVMLLEEEFVLVRPKSDAGKPAPTTEKLQQMKLLLLEEGHCFRDQALAYCKARPSTVRDFIEATNLSTLVRMVAAGMGVTLLPRMAVASETRALDVVASALKNPQPTRKIGMVWRKSNPLAPQLARIAEKLSKI